MKNRIPLSNQLILISLVVFLILTASITVFIPKALSPYLDEMIYNFLDQPFKYFNNNISEKQFKNNIGYIQIDSNENIIVSPNISNIIKIENYVDILDKIDKKNGKFYYLNKKYYYVRNIDDELDVIKITITNESFIEKIKSRLFLSLLPVIIITFLLILVALLIWCNFLVRKINLLVRRVNNINSDKYSDIPRIKAEDELKILESSIDDTRMMLLEQESFKNEMYQNISHDFKTPIAVIKSYIEASDDGIISTKEANRVVREQINIAAGKPLSFKQDCYN